MFCVVIRCLGVVFFVVVLRFTVKLKWNFFSSSSFQSDSYNKAVFSKVMVITSKSRVVLVLVRPVIME